MPRVLLSSVFGPYGVDDVFGRKENVMELFHNQVTREQGMFSLRMNHPSFGLHMLAANVTAATTVLDYPSEERFVEELRQGYDYVGISFITPNFAKARHMARLVRQHAPRSQILLGGHGTRIPGIEQLVDADHICRGEGVRWLRQILGEDPDAPFHHPVLKSATSKRILGLPRPVDGAVLMPGVGCLNRCRFCSTSHFFDHTYTAYLPTGDALFETCQRVEAELNVKEFFVMDENFLKDRARAERLLELMERHDASWRFGLFSSAETISQVGVDFLVRLGVYFLWLGVESKFEIYDKNRGVDFRALIQELQRHGISVLASGILFLEQHDPDTIQEDIDFMCSLGADFVQFMQLGPLPTTALYRSYQRQGLLREDVPYEEWHGQHQLWFRHPHFTPEQSEVLLRHAFQQDFERNGPSLLRHFATGARGALNIQPTSPMLARRREQFTAQCRTYRPALRWFRLWAPTRAMRAMVREVEALFAQLLGPETAADKLMSAAMAPFTLREHLAARTGRNVYQPPLQVTPYHDGQPADGPAAARDVRLSRGVGLPQLGASSTP